MDSDSPLVLVHGRHTGEWTELVPGVWDWSNPPPRRSNPEILSVNEMLFSIVGGPIVERVHRFSANECFVIPSPVVVAMALDLQNQAQTLDRDLKIRPWLEKWYLPWFSDADGVDPVEAVWLSAQGLAAWFEALSRSRQNLTILGY